MNYKIPDLRLPVAHPSFSDLSPKSITDKKHKKILQFEVLS